jgi:hypothetical protein
MEIRQHIRECCVHGLCGIYSRLRKHILNASYIVLSDNSLIIATTNS